MSANNHDWATPLAPLKGPPSGLRPPPSREDFRKFSRTLANHPLLGEARGGLTSNLLGIYPSSSLQEIPPTGLAATSLKGGLEAFLGGLNEGIEGAKLFTTVGAKITMAQINLGIGAGEEVLDNILEPLAIA